MIDKKTDRSAVDLHVVRFARRDTGVEYGRAKDHLAPNDGDSTLCGRPVNPSGFPTQDVWDQAANYGCSHCKQSVAKLTNAVVFYRVSVFAEWSQQPVGVLGADK